MYERDSTTLIRTKGVGHVEKLSTFITSPKMVTLILCWVSHILKRPARESVPPTGFLPPARYNPLDNLLVGTTTTQDPECTNTNTSTNTMLHLLSIESRDFIETSISFSQISRTFTGLRSLFLWNIKVTPQQTLSLAHLEVLSLSAPSETLLGSITTWDTPALRHVYLVRFSTPLTDMLDLFLGRYAHQIESLILSKFVRHLSPVFTSPPFRVLGSLYLIASARIGLWDS